MKVYLFVPTGEVRVPREKEFILILGLLREASLNVFGAAYPIYTRHEIEIPADAHTLRITSIYSTKNIICCEKDMVLVNLKKPKVKKWRWEYLVRCDGIKWETTQPYTEREMKMVYCDTFNLYRKIEDSEIEVEE